MANLPFIDATPQTKYRKATGAGTDGDPFITDNTISAIVPGTAAASLGKAEDAAHTTGDTGVMALGVRNDAGTAFAADGDYVPISVDASGAVRVTGGGGGTEYTEDAAAAANPVGGANILVRKDAPADEVSADGDNIAQRATKYGAAYTQVVNSSGAFVDTFGGGTQYTEDVAAAADPVGNAMILIRKDTLAGLTTADGDNVAARGTDKGELYVKQTDAVPVTDNSGSLTVDNAGTFAVQATMAASATSIAKVEDAGHTTGETGAFILGVRNDADTTLTSADLDYSPIAVNSKGYLIVDALRAGSAAIGKLTSNSGVIIGAVEIAAGQAALVLGGIAHDAAAAAIAPVLVGGYASAAAPSDVSADNDAVRAWLLRNGATCVQLTAAGALIAGDATNGIDVDVTRVTGTVTTGAVPVTSGGNSVSRVISAGSSNHATSAKASAGQVYGWSCGNTNGTARFLKIYNSASAPTPGSGTPILTIPIPGNTPGGAGSNFEIGSGIAFGTGIGWCITTGAADNDTGQPAANEVIVNLFFK